MKLEVGMYVRTDDGYIFQIKELLEKGKYNDSDNKIVQRFRIDGMYQKNEDYIETDYMYSDWIKKASHNIIDLIDVGDIVITPLGEIIQPYGGNIDELKDYWKITNNPIKSIVTKEQFESIKYSLEG